MLDPTRGFKMPSGEVHKRKTHCPSGHPYDEANTYWQTKRDGRRGRSCRACQQLRMERKRLAPDFKAREAEKMRRWRAANPEKDRERWQKREQNVRQLLLDARVGGCVKCDEKHPSCLDFHHRSGKMDKLGNIGEFRHFGYKRLLAEIAKCDVVCSNCHRKYHWEERQKRS